MMRSPLPPRTPPEPTPIATQDNATKQDGPNTKSTKELMDHVLDFLSTSSNETLLGVFALLMLGTYIILGRVGLLLIGVSLGVVLHASWEGTSHRGGNGETSSRKRKELALEVSHRLLDWPQRLASATVTADSKPDSGALATSPENLSDEDLEYLTFRPATAAALRLLTDTVIKDYVKYWYKPILPNDIIFPTSCRRTLTYFVTAVSSHLSHKRTEDTFLQFLTNSSSIIIVFFNELAAAFTATGSSPHEAKQIVDQYLENSPDSSLANVLSEEQQRKKLSMIADDILSNYLDTNSYRCSPVRDFLREIFAGVVLESTVTSLSRPEFINDWIIYLLQDGESELMHAIDAGVEGARNQGVGAGASKTQTPETIKTPAEPKQEKAAERKSESTDRATEDALLEAKRLSALIASHDEQSVPSDQSIHSDRPDRTSISAEPELEPPSTTPNSQEQSSAAIEGHAPTGSSSASEQPAPAPVPAAARQSGEDNPAPMSLHGAQVLVDDDSATSERGPIKSRPTWDYLLQVEPTSTRSSGWMVFRKYADFQSLHEMLETVSRLNNIQSFSSRFPALPPWKGKTRQELAHELERYLQEAVRHESLADTDRMRRFLEKEVNPGEKSTPKSGFSFPSQSAFENMGKGMLGALTNAPKGVAGGGRAMFDGVTGVFGGGHNRKPTISGDRSTHQKSPSKTERDLTLTPKEGSGSASDLGRVNSSPVGLNIDARSTSARSSEEDRPRVSSSSTSLSLDAWKEEKPQSPAPSDIDSNVNPTKIEQHAWASESTLASSGDANSSTSTDRVGIAEAEKNEETRTPQSPKLSLESGSGSGADEGESSENIHHTPQQSRSRAPITADETQIAVELIFAVINELYTLSSAWNIRRTLLNAAKTYILRPGSPTLDTIRDLLQDSMIESHTSDDALGDYARMPFQPRKNWLPGLHPRARRKRLNYGTRQDAYSVMGAAASREALEKIFDSLQVETVARGFVFSVMLQGLRVLTL
ncbi:hypothetical protein N7481_003500 [Penicillium waksmanii]|uniref:uncharacterized protein n=1 Tax=Penicillium waksmanii TaxID=69791 RepID=UPI002546875B|nr:uncharacterized protein N7481_003500 [Penicillium waksmanii]KAJ5988290.1 hypothetical protein N7481_003500 [Penicillium waksmanii]